MLVFETIIGLFTILGADTCSLNAARSQFHETLHCKPGDESVIATALSQGRKTVFLENGDYYTNRWILGPNTILQGSNLYNTRIYKKEGGDSGPILAAGRSGPRYDHDTQTEIDISEGTRNIEIKYLSVDGSLGPDVSAGIHISNIQNLTMDHVGAFSINHDAISIRGSRQANIIPWEEVEDPDKKCENIKLSTMRVFDSKGHGISLSTFCKNIEISQSIIRNTKKSGINCSTCRSSDTSGYTNSSIHDNEIHYLKNLNTIGHPTNYGGIRLSNFSKDIDIYNNTVTGYSRAIFILSGSQNNNIYNNILRSALRPAAYEYYPTDPSSPYYYDAAHAGRLRPSQGIFLNSPYNNVFCNNIQNTNHENILLTGFVDAQAQPTLDYPSHGDQNIIAMNYTSRFMLSPPPVPSSNIIMNFAHIRPVSQELETYGHVAGTISFENYNIWNGYRAHVEPGGFCLQDRDHNINYLNSLRD